VRLIPHRNEFAESAIPSLNIFAILRVLCALCVKLHPPSLQAAITLVREPDFGHIPAFQNLPVSRSNRFLRCCTTGLLAAIAALRLHAAETTSVVINEVYFDPPEKTKHTRFIELFNSTDAAVDLANWQFTEGVHFTFPAGTSIDPHGYIIVAQNLEQFSQEFGKKAIGPFEGSLRSRGEKIELRDAHGAVVESFTYGAGFPWPTATDGVGASLERINPKMPADNPASWRSSGYPVISGEAKSPDKRNKPDMHPTPGAQNSAYSEKLPPIVDQVAHAPLVPHTGQTLAIGARVRSPAGLHSVTLEYQIVEPGAYIRRNDDAYDTGWTAVPMHDDGKDGDARASDSIFTAVLPGSVSAHRRLIRYRIIAEDNAGLKVRVPYDDDDCPNFAAFCYNGAPAWTGSIEPGKTPPLTFPTGLMQTLPKLILIANKDDVTHSQWDGGYNKKKVRGTIVGDDGRVYDNVQFHNRGQASTFVSGKNKWGFKFDRGHNFDGRDEWGRKFAHFWDNMPMNACASPWVQSNRGMAGLDEAVSFRLYELAGVPSPRVRHVQYRVIDSAEEASAKNQYEGDLWGLYLVVEEPDGGFLSTRKLPEGNVYRIAGDNGDRKHQAPDQPKDGADWNSFRDASRNGQPEAWWREHMDMPSFYSFHAINRLVGNVDLREGDNHYFYHRPDGHWTVIPWDLDMMFIPKGHQSGRIDQDRCLDNPGLQLEYKNRCRELLDLLCSDAAPNGGQVGQVVDEFASIIHPRGYQLAWPELDQCLWDFNPHTSDKGAFYRNPTNGGPDGNWKRTLATPDFFGFAKFITDFCTDTRPESKWARDDGDPRGYGFGYLRDEANDPAVPDRPKISFAGLPGYSVNDLRFQCTPFNGSKGAGFAAMQWRIGEISAPGIPGYVAGQPRRYEIEDVWTSPEITTFSNQIKVPAASVHSGATYRARVRMKDNTGRWSRWSEPVQFVAR